MSMIPILLTLPLASLGYWLFLCWRHPLAHLNYFPGPPVTGLLTGNSSQIPPVKPWLTYLQWSKAYGSDLVHFRIYDKHTIIVNTYEDSVELLEKRSNNYSDRPHAAMLELMGWNYNTAFIHYGARWRAHRRLWQQLFKPEATLSYHRIQITKINDFLSSLLTSPNDFKDHYRTLAGAVIMSAMYGHDVTPKGDYFVGLAEAAVARLSESIFPGAVAVNALPILRFLPAWFPGAGFKHFGYEAAELTRQMQEVPIVELKKRMDIGDIPECRAAELLQASSTREEENIIASVSATAYAAGADTIVSSLGTFFLAMVQFPEVQSKAKEEIDLVVGHDRLINHGDRPSLPYLEGLYREVHRWRPVLPLSVAHSTTKDDVYKGCYIPKGTSIISNVWAIAHNPNTYPDPDLFNPNRFFTEDGELNSDECLYAFGYGRRVCPGRHMASATLWLTIATVLQTFDITQKTDPSGNKIPINGGYSEGLIVHPTALECNITPRDASARNLVLQAQGTDRGAIRVRSN